MFQPCQSIYNIKNWNLSYKFFDNAIHTHLASSRFFNDFHMIHGGVCVSNIFQTLRDQDSTFLPNILNIPPTIFNRFQLKALFSLQTKLFLFAQANSNFERDSDRCIVLLTCTQKSNQRCWLCLVCENSERERKCVNVMNKLLELLRHSNAETKYQTCFDIRFNVFRFIQNDSMKSWFFQENIRNPNFICPKIDDFSKKKSMCRIIAWENLIFRQQFVWQFAIQSNSATFINFQYDWIFYIIKTVIFNPKWSIQNEYFKINYLAVVLCCLFSISFGRIGWLDD